MKHRSFVVLFAGLGFVGVAVPAISEQERPQPVPHDLAGREQCLMCHRPGALEDAQDVPESHEGRPNETCLWCHATDSPMLTGDASTIPHAMEGRESCLMCHRPGAMEDATDIPESHEGREVEYCTLCHEADSA